MDDPVPLEKCDVQDKEKLAVFRYLRRQWIDMLSGDDNHAIHWQLNALLDADLEFRTILFSRKLCHEAGVPQNEMVHHFIDRGFIAHQSLTIRRITEDYDGQKRKAVFSLPRIISEIEDNRKLFTREMYVCVHGYPYDATTDEQDRNVLHEHFDRLSQTTPATRSRHDLIHLDVFRELRRQFESSKIVRSYANKRLAHAADPLTRSGNEAFELDHLETVYADLISITHRLSATILYNCDPTFLTYHEDEGNLLGSIDQPICPESKIEDLRRFWDKRHSELEMLERQAKGVKTL